MYSTMRLGNLRCFVWIVIAVALTALPCRAARQFLADGGSLMTLELNGSAITYHLGPSSGGQPAIDGAFLGTFSLADSNTLKLTGFANITLESSGTDVFGGRFIHSIYPVDGSAATAVTNISDGWEQLDVGKERHFSTNLNVNLLTGLTNGTYKLSVYTMAYGNFSPPMLEDNNGSNYIATFTVTEGPLPEEPLDATHDSKIRLGFSCITNTGFGNDLYIVGGHPDLGSWDPNRARKLHWTDGNVWTGQVAIEAGCAIEYKYIIRTNAADVFCDPANVIWMPGDNLQTNTPPYPAGPYSNKTIFYYSGWTNANIAYQSGQDTNWYNADMTYVGPGRHANEYLYTLTGIAQPGELITFVPNGYSNDTQYWDHSPATSNNYYTTLDAIFLQDGQVYNYTPPAEFTASMIVTTQITSSYAPTIPSRDIRIYLPRNYETNTWKDYPVLVMHDGQNVFEPGGGYGCWYAEHAANNLISLGVMRETIIVAVDNSSEREREYIAPQDDAGYGQGTADQYLLFLLDDVLPHVYANYRALTNAENTATMGSSFGGIASVYLSLATNRFNTVGAMSPSFWAITNFTDEYIVNADCLGRRFYLDCGTAEGASMWDPLWAVYNEMQNDGYTVNDDLYTVVGCGQDHNEAAWADRLPEAFTFLLPTSDEENQLAQQETPPDLEPSNVSSSQWVLSWSGLRNQQYQLEVCTDLSAAAWSPVSTQQVGNVPWATIQVTNTITTESRRYYRVTASGEIR